MTSRVRSAPASAPAGFTLVEMIVVLGVLALVMGLSAGLGRAPGGASKMRFAANEIAAALRLARSEAIIDGRKTELSFDLANHSWQRRSGVHHLLPAGVTARLLTTRDEVVDDAVAKIGFWPDGSSSGGRLTLDGEGRRITLGVDWLTGRVSLVQGG
jgi:general secretion pathway protein H